MRIISTWLLTCFEVFGMKLEIAKVLMTIVFPAETLFSDASIFDVKHINKVNASKNSLRIAINILSCKVKVSFYRTVYSSKESNDRRTKNRMSTEFTENKPRLVHLEDPFLQCWNMT